MSDMYMLSDLHCHILPGIDDGARDENMSGALLASEKAQSVRQIIFTPHFYADRMEPGAFTEARDQAFGRMKETMDDLGLSAMRGAEVRMQEKLLGMDLTSLRMGDTHYLLLEWPFSSYPFWGEDIVYKLLDAGIRPVFAHIERYEYFFRNEENLEYFRNLGCLFQVNADTVLNPKQQSQVLHLIRDGYLHIVASDAHNTGGRPSNLKKALDCISEHLGERAALWLNTNADQIFHDREVKILSRDFVNRIKKGN